ncbi:MAG: pyruvate-formate lyase-activating enzyme [Candidatus Berkelbacteria bacterium Licking1014_96]|uniref:Pyruvate-formate lyase-activating enzyme n=1 Tax=Candidatus Berkelbacteria bacterium Licking1014_96 TaxID=2017149 RepID=A0A554LF55_9BACT|nr:MAG: pyruvate-formate lyase-activating enzyme [Candidatus Berkelbacteria bacterium Licking1014_96]
MHRAQLFKKIEGKKVSCFLCNHHCLISNVKTGVCGVRLNKNGRLYSLVYGRPISVNIDPIEKKPLYHFMPGTATLSFGTFGCNLHCDWCQNWEISQKNKTNLDLINQLSTRLSPQKLIKLAKKEDCPSISYTYTEPTICFEYALDTMKLAHKAGLKNIWVSNGYFTKDCFKKIEPYLDAINIDLKSFDDKIYQRYCGARLQPVLDNLKRVYHLRGGPKRTSEVGEEQGHKIHLEITTLVIPGINDDSTQLGSIAEFIASLGPNIPWHLSRFFPCYKMTGVKPTSISTLKKAESIGQKAGLKYVYLGNI